MEVMLSSGFRYLSPWQRNEVVEVARPSRKVAMINVFICAVMRVFC